MKKNQLFQKLLLLVSFFFLSLFGFAQVTEEWVATYNGPPGTGLDIASALVADGSGNVYVTGQSEGTGTTQDYATIKYNPAGIQQWVARYNGPGNGADRAFALAVDTSGNVYVTGRSGGIGTDYDYATIKYNGKGVQQWVVRYNGPGNDYDEALSIGIDVKGNVFVTGRSVGAGTGFDYATIKYNASGIFQWVARYNGGPGISSDLSASLVLDPAGYIYVTGRSEGAGTSSDYATIKYTTAGFALWVRRYNGPANGDDGATSLVRDPAGNIYVTGWSEGTGTSEDYTTIKYNTGGVLQWVARYNGTGNGEDYASSLALDASGNVIVTGLSRGIGTGTDYATIKYNTAGIQQWVVRYNGPGDSTDKASSLAVDASGNVYVTGFSNGVGTHADFATIKYKPTGGQLWVIRYDGAANSDGATGYKSLAVDDLGNVYVTGYTSTSVRETLYVYTTIKYSQPPAIAARSATAKLSVDLPPARFRVSNYPNPVSATTRIEYELPYDGQVSVKVYDILGREVATLVNANMKAGYHSTDLNASSFQKGMYSYRVIFKTEKNVLTQSGKMIVIR